MTPKTDLANSTTMVVGASRGLGRGIAIAFAEAGAPVIAVARSETALNALAREVSGIHPEVADAGDPSVAGSLIDRYDPHTLVLVAGATPLHRPIQHHTWETFSTNWHTDVRIAFHWVREALLKPLRPSSRVVVISSGAALGPGSPLSGGYAGGKPSRPGDHFYGALPAGAHAVDRPGSPGGRGARRPRRPDRGGIPHTAPDTADPGNRRRRGRRAPANRSRKRRAGLRAQQRRTKAARATSRTSCGPRPNRTPRSRSRRGLKTLPRACISKIERRRQCRSGGLAGARGTSMSSAAFAGLCCNGLRKETDDGQAGGYRVRLG